MASAIAAAALVAAAGCAAPRDEPPPPDYGGAAAAAPTDSAAAARSAAQGAGAATRLPARADSAMQAVLDAFAALAPASFETLSAERARQRPTLADAARRVLAAQRRDTAASAVAPGVRAVERAVRGASGALPATIYSPAGDGARPVIVYFHGGGWTTGDRRAYDASARALARAAEAVVVSVERRRDAAFPAQHADAIAAYRWATDSAATVGGDPARIALAGEGAGGNLAVATAIAARDAGLRRPRAVLAIYPFTQTDTTASYVKYADVPPLGRAGVQWSLRELGRTAGALADARVHLVDANLRDLPPTTIVNAEIDPLRDDGALLEQAMRDAGSPVDRRLFAGVTHDFFGLGALLPTARDAQRFAGDKLKAALAR